MLFTWRGILIQRTTEQTFFWMIQITPKTSLCRKTDFSLYSLFIFPPPHSGLLGNKIFCMSRIIKILSSYAKKSSWHVLIRSCQDLIKVFQEMFVYQDLGKMFQVFARVNKILHDMASCFKFRFTGLAQI